MKTYNLLLFIGAIFMFSLATCSAFNVTFNNPSPVNGSLIYNDTVTINVGADQETSSIIISLYDINGRFITDKISSGTNATLTPNSLLDGIYYFYADAVNLSGQNAYSEVRFFEVINTPFLVLDDTVVANGSILRINSTEIRANTNRNTTYLDIVVIDPSGVESVYSISGDNKNKVPLNLTDGWYTFYARAELRERSGVDMNSITENGTYLPFMTENRTIYVDWHTPQLNAIDLTPALSNLTTTDSVRYALRFNTTENITSRVILYKEGRLNISLSNNHTTNDVLVEFLLQDLSVGNYSLRLVINDQAGNTNRTELGNFTVSQAPSNGGNPGSGGGGGNSGSSGGVIFQPPVRLQNLSNNQTNINQTAEEPFESETSGFFNTITGAVVGALKKPGIRFGMYFIAILLALFIVFNMREYFNMQAEKSGKKNGKKSKESKEENSEE